MGKPPVQEARLGNLKCAIFEGEFKGKTTHSFKFQKSYKDKNGDWQNTDFFFLTDLRDLALLALGLVTKSIKFKKIESQKQQPTEEPEPIENEDDLPF